MSCSGPYCLTYGLVGLANPNRLGLLVGCVAEVGEEQHGCGNHDHGESVAAQNKQSDDGCGGEGDGDDVQGFHGISFIWRSGPLPLDVFILCMVFKEVNPDTKIGWKVFRLPAYQRIQPGLAQTGFCCEVDERCQRLILICNPTQGAVMTVCPCLSPDRCLNFCGQVGSELLR